MKILIVMVLIIISLVACTELDSGEVDLFNQTPEPMSLNEQPGYGAVGSFLNEEPTLEQMLTYALQDEYLARSEYEFIIDELGAATPFTNIIKAEEKHIELLIPLEILLYH